MNWSEGEIPTDVAIVDNGGEALIGAGVASLGSLHIGSTSLGSGTVSLLGGELSLSILNVGSAGTGFASIDSGTVTASQRINIGTLTGGSGRLDLINGHISSSGTMEVGASVGLVTSGTFSHFNGTNAATYLRINPRGNYRLSGGTLSTVAGMVNLGTMSFAGGNGTIVLNGLVDLSRGTLSGIGNTNLVGQAGSILVVPAGFDVATDLGSYTTAGLSVVSGNTLTIPAGQTYSLRGELHEHVEVLGSIGGAPGIVSAFGLFKGLSVSGAGSVSTSTISINNQTSGISGGTISTNIFRIADDGIFTQSGGQITFSAIRIGTNVGDSGTLILSGGILNKDATGSSSTFGADGSGTVEQSGGTHVLSTSSGQVHFGFNPGASGVYRLSAGTLESPAVRTIFGMEGSGTFTQTGGVANIRSIRLGFSGGDGFVELSGPGLLNLSGVLAVGGIDGTGHIVQSSGTFNVGSFVNGAPAGVSTAAGLGTFTKSGGQLNASAIVNDGTWTHSGGTFSGMTFNNRGTATLGGIQDWASGAALTNTGIATFTTDAGTVARRLTVNASAGTVTFDATQHLVALNIDAAAVKVTAEVNTRVVADAFTMTGAGGSLDLSDGVLMSGSTTLSEMRGLLRLRKVLSSLGDQQQRLGYALSASLFDTFPASYLGEAIDDSTLLVELSYAGDANLDGIVDRTDLAALAAHWNGGDAFWTEGDFNYDGLVDVADLYLLTLNWNAGSAAPAPPLAGMLGELGLPTSVPEPGVAVWVLLLGLAMRRRL